MKQRPAHPARSAPTVLRRKSSLLGYLGQSIGLKNTGFWGAFFGGESWAGEHVTADRAMQLSSIFSGIRLTSTTIASLPPSMFEEGPLGPRKVTGGPADTLVRLTPNQEQTPMEFWEQMVACEELIGDGLARIHKVGRRAVALTLLNPLTTRDVDTVQGGWEWKSVDAKGRETTLQPSEVFQLKGFSMGGRRGMSVVAYGAQSMGLAIAAEKTAGKLFKSGMRQSGFLNTNTVIQDGDRARIKEILSEYTGQEKAGGLMILEGGMTYTPMSMNANEAELLLTRKFQIEELARWLGMPPVLLGHAAEGVTQWGSGVDSIIQSWLTLGLGQRLKRIEQAVEKRIMSAEERAGLWMKFNADALLRINSPSRATFIATMLQNGVINRNEARELLERGRIPGGEIHTAQVNLVPLDQLGQKEASAPAALRSAMRSFLGIEDPEPSREGKP